MRSRNPAIVLLLFAGVACRHVPPDLEARAAPAAKAPEERRAPLPGELAGAWMSVEIRGALEAAGGALVYVFTTDGRYTGAAIGTVECTPLAGSYVLDSTAQGSTLQMDGDLLFRAAIVDGRLELVSDNSYVLLNRINVGRAGQPSGAAN